MLSAEEHDFELLHGARERRREVSVLSILVGFGGRGLLGLERASRLGHKALVVSLFSNVVFFFPSPLASRGGEEWRGKQAVVVGEAGASRSCSH